eukprot:11178620-Lingulodinium_polyedra.AAC.1
MGQAHGAPWTGAVAWPRVGGLAHAMAPQAVPRGLAGFRGQPATGATPMARRVRERRSVLLTTSPSTRPKAGPSSFTLPAKGTFIAPPPPKGAVGDPALQNTGRPGAGGSWSGLVPRGLRVQVQAAGCQRGTHREVAAREQDHPCDDMASHALRLAPHPNRVHLEGVSPVLAVPPGPQPAPSELMRLRLPGALQGLGALRALRLLALRLLALQLLALRLLALRLLALRLLALHLPALHLPALRLLALHLLQGGRHVAQHVPGAEKLLCVDPGVRGHGLGAPRRG